MRTLRAARGGMSGWGRRAAGLGLSLWVLAVGPAKAVQPEVYANTTRLIERLYLYPEQVDPQRLLLSAAQGAARDTHWLMVEPHDDAISLRHGDGTFLGTVQVADWEGLPGALQELELRIAGAGYPVPPIQEVRLSILRGMTLALDRYSRVMHGDPKERFERRLTGEREGVGAVVGYREGRLVIAEVIEGGPAEEGGLQAGDVLLRIDGEATVNMPVAEAVRRISGQEGSQVVLEVRREAKTLELKLTRARFTEPNVRWRVLDEDVGYLHISHVSQRTVANMRRAMARLQEQGALENGLVLDLRGNTGGSMKEAARAADVFLTEGLLLRTAGPDGGKVQNLQGEMHAEEEEGDEISIPLMLVVDEKTASGSEILAGALVEHGRAALVGIRTYGKGTVQKIYNIDPEAQLKLTVAQYLLANDRQIAEVGLVPDVVVGKVELSADGMRHHDFDEALQLTSYSQILPQLIEREGWRGQRAPRVDLSLEIARQAVLRTQGAARADLLRSLNEVAAEVRAEQERALHEALAARELDWSPADTADPRPPRAKVTLTSHPAPERVDVYTVMARVENLDEVPLHRVLVELSCPTLSAWDGLVLPVGRLEVGASGMGEVHVPLPPGISPREDLVGLRLRIDGRPTLTLEQEVLTVRSTERPRIAAQARLAPHSPETDLYRAEITLQNMAPHPITGVRARFAYPRDLDVELVDLHAQIPVLPARGSERLDLTLRLGPEPPPQLPLDLEILAERYGTLASWPLPLAVDGSEVYLQAPEIRVQTSERSAPAGSWELPVRVIDDGRIDHVVVHANGEKVAWAPGRRGRVELSPALQIRPGVNRILVEAEDEQGLRASRWIHVRGERPSVDTPVTVDAAEE